MVSSSGPRVANEVTHFRVLDVEASLDVPTRIGAPIQRAYHRFLVENGGGESGLVIRLDSEHSREIHVGKRRLPIVAGLDATLQVYQHFFHLVLDNVGSYAMIHAAALEGDDGAILLAGPSGLGKTSLTLGLVERGYRFLSDDFAPLDLGCRRVSPYPRTVGILPEGEARIPIRFREAATRQGICRLFGKALIDVGEVLGEEVLAPQAVPLRNIVVLSTGGKDDAGTTLEIGCLEKAAPEIERRLRAIGGVTIENRQSFPELRVWRVALEDDEQPAGQLFALLEDDSIVVMQKKWGGTADFSTAPRLERITRREAAELLCRELLNRRGRGLLLQRYGGSLPELYLDLAGALSEAACWKLSVGRFAETIELIGRIAGS